MGVFNWRIVEDKRKHPMKSSYNTLHCIVDEVSYCVINRNKILSKDRVGDNEKHYVFF